MGHNSRTFTNLKKYEYLNSKGSQNAQQNEGKLYPCHHEI